MEDTPAAMDRETGQMYINPKRYFDLTPFQREFVKLHEKGHYVLNTDSELAADEYAFNHLAGTRFRSLKQCIECLEEILDENLIGHKVRIDHMYQLAIRWDKQHPQFTGTTELKQSQDLVPSIDEKGLLLKPTDNSNPTTGIASRTLPQDNIPSENTSPLTENSASKQSRPSNKHLYLLIGAVVLIACIALIKS